MEKPAETTAAKDEKRSAFLPGFIVWPVVILLLYVLSIGPIWMLVVKKRIPPFNEFMDTLYAPIEWAYGQAPLHKPLGMYFHLWVPTIVDKDGDESGWKEWHH